MRKKYAASLSTSCLSIHSEMALDSNGWLARDEHKSNVNQQNPIYLIPERRLSESGLLDSSSKSILSPTEHRYIYNELIL